MPHWPFPPRDLSSLEASFHLLFPPFRLLQVVSPLPCGQRCPPHGTVASSYHNPASKAMIRGPPAYHRMGLGYLLFEVLSWPQSCYSCCTIAQWICLEYSKYFTYNTGQPHFIFIFIFLVFTISFEDYSSYSYPEGWCSNKFLNMMKEIYGSYRLAWRKQYNQRR